MTSTPHRNAWIWVAITAIALASVARAHSSFELARAYANPVIGFFSGDQPAARTAALTRQTSAEAAREHSFHGADAGMWLELLPIFFVGLVSPLSLLSARSSLCLGRTFSAPILPSLFQRPPPFQLV
ncbi:MAG TPA: hypothetical protein VG225_02860 [Terracidiphilus sp.]|nr:hypothetical protein [Terracidiphilus sp.]